MARVISGSVGIGGANRSADVRCVQELLNGVPPSQAGPTPLLKVDGLCGDKTKAAIQRFQLRQLGQRLADGRVDPGGPTLAKLNELSSASGGSLDPRGCILIRPCPVDAQSMPLIHTAPSAPTIQLARFGPAMRAGDDASIMQAALGDSRRTLKLAREALGTLVAAFTRERAGKPLTQFEKRVLISVGRWLKVDTSPTTAARANAASVIRRAMTLMDRNLNVRTSSGAVPTLRRVPGPFHAFVDGNPDNGVNCGDPFFDVDGPNCRRDVITHEFPLFGRSPRRLHPERTHHPLSNHDLGASARLRGQPRPTRLRAHERPHRRLRARS